MGLENPIHLILILLVVLLVFGAKRLPEMGRSLGDGMRGFKEAISGQSPAEPASSLTSAPVHSTATPTVPVTVAPTTVAPVTAESIIKSESGVGEPVAVGHPAE